MIDALATVDQRDVFYVLLGAAFLGLTLAPALSHTRWFNPPAFYIGVGALAAFVGLPHLSPLDGEIGRASCRERV